MKCSLLHKYCSSESTKPIQFSSLNFEMGSNYLPISVSGPSATDEFKAIELHAIFIKFSKNFLIRESDW